MLKFLSRLLLKLWGWKVIGNPPPDKKYLIIVAPHTSNWDFVIAVIARKAIDIEMHYMGKSPLFKPPHGFIFRWLGGFPVDRSKPNGLVNSAVELFRNREHFILTLSPEGTRKKVDRWKTGFWHIANQAGIPICMVGLDYGKKQVVYLGMFNTTGNIENDMPKIKARFKEIRGKHPELGAIPV